MTVRIGILGAADSPYVRDLLQAANEVDVRPDVQCLNFAELSVATSGDMMTERFDAVVVRSMPIGSLEQVIFRMDCLHVWEQSGIAVVNPPRALEVAIDKWLTLHRLQSAGIAIPPTFACQTRESALEAFENLGGDVVVKPLFGGEGRGIVRVQDKDMAWRVFSTLQQMRSVLYLQQFHQHFGYDIRVLFVGDQHFCVRRQAHPDSWRTNLSQRGKAARHELTDQQLDLAQRSARAVGGNVVGVDLLPCKDGVTRVLEVNAVPGWRGLARELDVDVGQIIINYVCGLVG